MRLRLLVAATCFAFVTGLGSWASAQTYPEVLFILDSSGSMSEDAGGETKLAAAKRVMQQVVPSLPPEVRVGLVAYGHRRPGDCRDIEILMPAGSTDREQLLDKVNSLEPRGKTPITRAILTSTEMLKTKDVLTSIVLVSDGIETCGGNPCEVVRQLQQTGAKFVMHTVGFAVDAAAQQQLQCIAQGGQGQYFAAADGAGLLAALQQVSQEVTDQVAAAKVENVVIGSGLGKLQLSMPAESHKSLAYVEIRNADDNRVVKTISDVTPNSLHPLRSKVYRVAVGFKIPNYGTPTRTELGEVAIVKGQTRQLTLGSIGFNLPKELVEGGDWRNRVAIESVRVVDAGSRVPAAYVTANGNSHYNLKDKPVLPGVYDVEFQYKNNADHPTTVAAQVVVQPGQRTTVTLDSGIQFKRPEGKIAAWRLYRAATQTDVAAEDAGQPAPRELAFEVRAYPGIAKTLKDHNLYYPYLLPPGTFDIEIDLVDMNEPLPVAEGVRIDSGQLLRFDAGF